MWDFFNTNGSRKPKSTATKKTKKKVGTVKAVLRWGGGSKAITIPSNAKNPGITKTRRTFTIVSWWINGKYQQRVVNVGLGDSPGPMRLVVNGRTVDKNYG